MSTSHDINGRVRRKIKRTEPKESEEKITTWLKRTSKDKDHHAKKNAFVEFELVTNGRSGRVGVVCFSNRNFCTHLGPVPNKVVQQIVGPDMPETWLEGFDWQDLNIMTAAYVDAWMEHGKVQNQYNLRNLQTFIRAFGWKKHDKLFMHIWHERLPTPEEQRINNPLKPVRHAWTHMDPAKFTHPWTVPKTFSRPDHPIQPSITY